MTKYRKGEIVKGTVTCIEPYGVFMSFDDYYTGLIHISEISRGFVHDITDFVNVGDCIYVEILDVSLEEAHLRLSIKDIKYRIDGKPRGKRIVETASGFSTLKRYLPIWIDKKIKSEEKAEKSIDK